MTPMPWEVGRPVMAPWLEAVARAAHYPVVATEGGPVLAIRWDRFTDAQRDGVWAMAPSDPLRALLVLRPDRLFPAVLAGLLAGRLEVLMAATLTAPSLPVEWHPDTRTVVDLLRTANGSPVAIPQRLLFPGGHHGDDTEVAV